MKLGNPNGARALRGKQGRQQGSRGLDQGAWKCGGLYVKANTGMSAQRQLSIQLRRVGSGVRYIFTNPGE